MGDEELAAVIQAVRDRARSAASNGSGGLEGLYLPNLMPLVHGRDAAEAKVAAIGTVNPRPPGLKNAVAQKFKRLIARMLDWHVREQVEFNRASIACIHASIEAMSELSRGLSALATHHKQLREENTQLREEIAVRDRHMDATVQELLDIRRHWVDWRAGFEDRRNTSEIHMLRTISELQAAFQQRVTLVEQAFRDLTALQHKEFKAEAASNIREVQDRLWQDVVRMRSEFEGLIHTELRLIRQRQVSGATPPAAVAQAATSPSQPVEIPIDWMRLAEAFRGPETDIRERQKHHIKRFAGVEDDILDLGCGRGEFLEAAKEAGLNARGIDQSEECIALCRSKGLAAEQAELFSYLEAATDQSLGGIYCSQVVEHIPPDRLPVLVRLIAAKLRRGGLVGIETPNPECLAIFATHFYIDPSHTRPVPPVLLSYYLKEAGMHNIDVERLAPAIESIPALKELPAAVVDALFGGLDYAIFARKL